MAVILRTYNVGCTIVMNSLGTLLFSQFQQDVIKNKFPAERDTYIKLTGLMAQVQL